MIIDLRKVFYFVGLIIMLLALAMLVPVIFSIVYKDQTEKYFLLSFLITMGIALLLMASGHISQAKNNALNHREGMAIVGFAWLVVGLLGTLPYLISGAIPNIWDAIFESVSGFSTTGASILSDIEALPAALQFWRSFTNWLGGMGIVVLMFAVLPFFGLGGMQLFKSEVPGPTVQKLRPRLNETAKTLWAVYIGFTILLLILLLLGNLNFLDAICHSFSTVATGGFSTKNSSIGYFNSSYINIVIIIFMLLCSINFSAHYQVLKGNFRAFYKNPEVMFFLVVATLVTIIVTINLISSKHNPPGKALLSSAFHTASIISTTAFNIDTWGDWPGLSKALLMSLFFVGGCSGSTSGGIKCVRVILFFKCTYRLLRQCIHPRAVIPIRLGGVSVPESLITANWAFLGIYVLVLLISTLSLSVFDIELSTAFSSAASCLGNIGPALGDVGDSASYGHLPSPAKIILSLGMFLGRLEYLAILVLFVPDFWKK